MQHPRGRHLALILRAVLAGGLVAPALLVQPAQAHLRSCAVSGTMRADRGFNVMFLAPPVVSNFDMRWSAGSCTSGALPTVYGVLNGLCDAASGSGLADEHHALDVQWTPGTLTFTGGVTGSLSIAADAGGGENCLFGADHFLVSGTLTVAA